MKYQDVFPEQSKLEAEVIRSSAWVPDVVPSVLDDAFQRGVKYGINTVVDDPQAYDLVSSDRGGN